MVTTELPRDSRFPGIGGQPIPSVERFSEEYARKMTTRRVNFGDRAPYTDTSSEDLERAEKMYQKCVEGIMLSGEELASFNNYKDGWHVQNVLGLVALKPEDAFELPVGTPVWYAPEFPVAPGIHPNTIRGVNRCSSAHPVMESCRNFGAERTGCYLWIGGMGHPNWNLPRVWLAADDEISIEVPSYLTRPEAAQEAIPFREKYQAQTSKDMHVGAMMPLD